MDRPPYVHWVEKRFARLPFDASLGRAAGHGARDGRPAAGSARSLSGDGQVVVIGGGIAGSAFARQFLAFSGQAGLGARVVMINHVNCNYCGGLVTDLSLNTLRRAYGLEIPGNVVLNRIGEAVYVNPAGGQTIRLDQPLVSMMRTSKFGELGFDDSLRTRISEGLPERDASRLTLIEPARVIEAVPPTAGGPGRVVYARYDPSRRGMVLVEQPAHVLVLATGLRSLGTGFMKRFSEVTGFRPPPTMPASVTEIDVGPALHNRLDGKILIAADLVPGCVAALISKRHDWLTVTSLGTVLTRDDLRALFGHPAVREFIDLPDAHRYLRCDRICRAQVYTGPARTVCGQGWAVLGDLSGYGRVLKDGYFASLYGAQLLAATLVERGTAAGILRRHYAGPLRAFVSDNRVGMGLYHLNQRLERKEWFCRLLLQAGIAESAALPFGGAIHAAIRALVTGELSYRWIAALLWTGLLRHLAVSLAWSAGRGVRRTLLSIYHKICIFMNLVSGL